MPDIGNIPTGAGVFQHAQQTAVCAGFQNVIHKAGLPLLGPAAQSLEVFQSCPDAHTSAVQRLPDFAQVCCRLPCSDASHLCTVLCIFCEHPGVRPGKCRAAHRFLDQTRGGQCAQQVSDRDAAERSAGRSARLSSDHDIAHRGQQRASGAVCRRCKAHGSQRRNNGRNGSRHFRSMLRCVVDAFLYPRQRRLRRISYAKQGGVQHRQNAVDDVGQIRQTLGDAVRYVNPHSRQFFLCRKELIAHIDEQAVCRITCHLAYRFACVQTDKQFFLHATAVCTGVTSHKQGILECGQVAHNF